MRKNNTQDIKAIIRDMLKENHLDQRFDEQEVIDAWPKIVGSMFAKYTSKVYLKNKILYVTLTSSAARQELSMAKSHLIRSVNDMFDQEMVRDIVFY
jgi:predicted nucleic acid-binding Zn ribbon protein